MSSLAQEESRSISENVTWGHRKRMADGKVTVSFAHFLGYDRGPDGNLVVNREQAKIVRLIFRWFMDGMTPVGICHMLEDMGIRSPGGKVHWRKETIVSMLTNEKYKGDALLQKKFTVDFLTKRRKANEGEVPQYYITGNHEPIIPPEEFDAVQAEIARRRSMHNSGLNYSGTDPFSAKLVCGDCGMLYGRKVWHSTDKYKTFVWRCNWKYRNKEAHCRTPNLSEEQIKRMFTEAVKPLYAEKASVTEDCEALAAMLRDTTDIDRQIAKAERELKVTAILDDAEQQLAAEEHLDKLREQRTSRIQRGAEIRRFAETVREQPVWSEQAWNLLVQQVAVHHDGTAEFLFRSGYKTTVQIPPR